VRDKSRSRGVTAPCDATAKRVYPTHFIYQKDNRTKIEWNKNFARQTKFNQIEQYTCDYEDRVKKLLKVAKFKKILIVDLMNLIT